MPLVKVRFETCPVRLTHKVSTWPIRCSIVKKERRRSELYDDFAVLVAGSGSDKAEKIGHRHAVFANWMRSKLKIKLKDPKRLFDMLEREVVWWRDGRTCKNPNCGGAVPFKEATVHHVTEHTVGGPTELANAVLVCKDCAPKRKELQAAESELKEYLRSRTQVKGADD